MINYTLSCRKNISNEEGLSAFSILCGWIFSFPLRNTSVSSNWLKGDISTGYPDLRLESFSAHRSLGFSSSSFQFKISESNYPNRSVFCRFAVFLSLLAGDVTGRPGDSSAQASSYTPIADSARWLTRTHSLAPRASRGITD